MINDIEKFLKDNYFFRDSPLLNIDISNGGTTVSLMIDYRLDDEGNISPLYEKNHFWLSFETVEKFYQDNTGIKGGKVSNKIHSMTYKNSPDNNVHSIVLLFSDERRIEVSFHQLVYSPYSYDAEEITIK